MVNMINQSQIVVIDFGSQYAHLIARRIRQLGVLANVFLPTISVDELGEIRGLIFSGGPQSVYEHSALKYNSKLFERGVPILGLCYGHQLLVQHFGGRVEPGKTKEYGFAVLQKLTACPLFSGLKKEEKVWMSHGDVVSKLPPDFLVVGRTSDCPIAAVFCEKRKIYGLQFHPEVTHTPSGQRILENFVFNICQCQKDWSIEKFWQQIVSQVKKTVGKRNVFLLVSGGVDSAVAFAVLEKTLGKNRVFGLHLDNGFMRLNESKEIKQALADAGFDNLQVVDASQEFLKAVAGVSDPEEKRRIIGRTFLQVKDRIMQQHKMNPRSWVLGQGTIYPDTIETGGTAHADVIKTHHNRVAEILRLMKMGRLVEPLSSLYKDEVREVGRHLGLPQSLVSRHPFPGPGLAIRVLCSPSEIQIEDQEAVSRRLQQIVGPKLKAYLLPLKSVGVQGDSRTYRQPVVIAGKADWQTLRDLSVKITNELISVNRVVYLVYPSEVDFIKLCVKAAYLTEERLDLLRQVDHLVNQEIKKKKIYHDIWQFPVVLAPLTLGGGETIILRPVQSKEAMTANFYPMPWPNLYSMVEKISLIAGIDLVLYDITNKPPGTIEWE